MTPGRELGALIAEKVMGWTNCDATAKWDRWEYGDPGEACGVGIPYES